MDKCSDGGSYLTVDKHCKARLQAQNSLKYLADADWKSINPPPHLNHREFRFWVSSSTGKCLTVFREKSVKRTVGITDCEFDGSNAFQLFAFLFHYHKVFCCCGEYNEYYSFIHNTRLLSYRLGSAVSNVSHLKFLILDGRNKRGSCVRAYMSRICIYKFKFTSCRLLQIII